MASAPPTVCLRADAVGEDLHILERANRSQGRDAKPGAGLILSATAAPAAERMTTPIRAATRRGSRLICFGRKMREELPVRSEHCRLPGRLRLARRHGSEFATSLRDVSLHGLTFDGPEAFRAPFGVRHEDFRFEASQVS